MKKIIIGAVLLVAVLAAGKAFYQNHLNKALFKAVRMDQKDEVARLLDGGADLNARDTLGQTPLHSAAYGSTPAIIDLLMARGAALEARDRPQGGTPVHWAVINGRIDNLRLLLEKGADPNARDLKGLTPMHWAVMALKIDDFTKAYNVNILLEFKADPRIRDLRGKTPLDYAIEKRNVKVQELLE